MFISPDNLSPASLPALSERSVSPTRGSEDQYVLAEWLLVRSNKALAQGSHERADRLLSLAWEAYFQGK